MKTLSLASLAVLATVVSSATRAQSPSPMEQLHRLETATSIDRDGLPPWHLRMSFELYDLDGGHTRESGTIEEWWVSPQHKRIVITSPSYNANQQTAHPYDREAYLVHLLLQQVVHPIPHFDRPDELDAETRNRKFEKAELSCTTVDRLTQSKNSNESDLPQFCVEPNTNILRLHFDQGNFSAVRNKLGNFLNTSVALDNILSYRGKLAITGHVDTLEGYKPAEAAPESAIKSDDVVNIPALSVAGKNITKVAPRYPDEAKSKRIGGIVIVCALISKQGTISSLDVVASPDRSLSEASLAAVRQWTYEPFLVNGSPTEVETTVRVNFNLNLN